MTKPASIMAGSLSAGYAVYFAAAAVGYGCQCIGVATSSKPGETLHRLRTACRPQRGTTGRLILTSPSVPVWSINRGSPQRIR